MRKDFEKMLKLWPKPDSEVPKRRQHSLEFDWGMRIVGKYVFDFNFEPVETFTASKIEKVLSREKLDTTGVRDIVEGRILYDPQSFFAEFKRKQQHYPSKLSERIVKNRLCSLHEDYFMTKTNIGREDAFAATFSVLRFFEDVGHLLFALNRRWYPGIKRLTKSLAELKLLPPDHISLMEGALDPTTTPRWDDLEDIPDQVYAEILSLCEHGQNSRT
jgi:hypothetical protein